MNIMKRYMPDISRTFRAPAIISSMLVLPFIVLELTNRRGYGEGFPVALFVFMWFLPLCFVLILSPVVRRVRAGATTASLLPWVAIAILIAWFWAAVVLDQIPCFLGVPNCD